jgi:DNA-binding GntR family transcriptional regulator
VIVRDHAEAVARVIAGWDASAAPLYRALANALAEAVRLGRVARHLPSERALAEALNVSRGTVAAAYEILRERDMLDRQRGSGSVARMHRPTETCDDPIACVQAFLGERAQPSSRTA